MRTLKEAWEVHDTLNPKLWDLKTGKLRTEVRDKIIEIGMTFEKYIEVPISILDIHLVGSNCNFCYSDKSDLDVHIIANFEQVGVDETILQQLYNMKKARFNEAFDISLHGVPVEVYIEDVKTGVVSNGIYSINQDDWIVKPVKQQLPPKLNIERQLGRWEQRIADVVECGDVDTINNCLNCLYMVRKNSIAADGEYGVGNILFKEIRNTGGLGKLRDALTNATNKQLTLEGMSTGSIINSLEG